MVNKRFLNKKNAGVSRSKASVKAFHTSTTSGNSSVMINGKDITWKNQSQWTA